MLDNSGLQPLKKHANPIANFSPSFTQADEESLLQAFRSGWVSSKGPELNSFEKALGSYFGARHACAVSSGTTALHAALVAIGVGPGDEVVIPDLTYIAVANAVLYCGATPVIADVNPVYWGLDPESVKSVLSPKTRAVIAVHAFGHPVDMDPLLELSKKHGFVVIEDVSQAFGALYKGRRAGSLAEISVHSFFANKIITTGEGGAVVTSDADLHEKVASLRNHCESTHTKYLHQDLGYNYRMTNLQAAIGNSQMKRVDTILEQRAAVLHLYQEALEDLETVVLNPAEPWAQPVNWMVCAHLEVDVQVVEKIKRHFNSLNIEARGTFVPLSRQPALTGRVRATSTPAAAVLSQKLMMLPSGSNLSRDAVLRICDVLRMELG